MTHTLRHATVDDAAGIANVQVSTWRDAYATIIDSEFLKNFSVEEATRTQIERIETDGAYRLVATIEGQVVGYAVSNVKKDDPFANDWFMFALYVLPECQGLGIGKALMSSIIAKGRKRGFSRLVFGVFSDNEPSKEFYRRQGAQFLERLNFEVGGKNYPTDYCEILIT
jgi:ribosomal protein S18 acetylase RimI-like enzyme